MFIFDSSPGVVGTVVTGGGLPFSLVVGGNGAVPMFQGVSIAKAILTGFDYAGQSGLGINHTLRDRIYFYVFSERVAPVTVSGIAFSGVCNPGAPGKYTGFDWVLSYYEATRASYQGTVVRLVLGPSTTVSGLMKDFRFRLEDAQTGVGSFSFDFVSLPRHVGGGGGPQLVGVAGTLPTGSGGTSTLTGTTGP